MSEGGPRFACCADIGYAAEDTHGNAEEAAQWARENHFASLVIVTGRYHMPRTMREFSAVLPDVTLIAYPVDQSRIDLNGWWRHPRTAQLLHREYVKYLASLVTTRLAHVDGCASLHAFPGVVSARHHHPVADLPAGAAVAARRDHLAGAGLVARHVFRLEDFCRHGLGNSGNASTRGPVLVAAKHMSMWDTLALYLALDAPAIVLKRELLYIPFLWLVLWKATAIAIDRGAGAGALRKMQNAAKEVLGEGRPILIFPEGTRKKPGAAPDYKPGVAGLYALLDVACVPVALNSGVYWTGFRKKPGTIVLEFLEPIPPGLKRAEFMNVLEKRIETATNRLLP